MQESYYGDIVIDKKLCPHCLSKRIYYRQTNNNWKCQECLSEFNEPLYIYAYDPDFVRTLDEIHAKRNQIEIVTQKPKVDYSTCALCKSKKAQCVHHIDLDRYDNRFDNLAPLCHKCHGTMHGLLNLIIGDVASQRECLSILVDSRIPIGEIYRALQLVRYKFATEIEHFARFKNHKAITPIQKRNESESDQSA
jgi:hypothetical protein